jgi:two-component system, NtrC family, sensor kinase
MVLYGVVLAWIAGGAVALVGYRLMESAIRQEAADRLRDHVQAAQRLLTDDGFRVEPDDRMELAEIPEALLADLKPLVDRTVPGGRASGFVTWPDRGLCHVTLEHEPAGPRTVVVRSLRGANDLADRLRGILFAEADDSRATVTIFEEDRRIATNVRTNHGERAVGTLVSEPVARQVLGRGEPWSGRAFVVDHWRITCYLPLHSPRGEVLGMLYAGLEEGPYVAESRRHLGVFLLVILGVTVLISVAAWVWGRRLGRPLAALTESSQALAEGEARRILASSGQFEEIDLLTAAFNSMVDRVIQRTEELEASRQTAQSNLDDYLEILAFVAHELKSPLAGAQGRLNLIEEGYVGPVPESMRSSLDAVHRYLRYGVEVAISFNHLSRAESPGFTIRPRPVESLIESVLRPAVEDQRDEAERRRMTIDLSGDDLAVEVDPDMLRVPVDNLLGNAIKYGRENTAVEVRLTADDRAFRLAVRNQGVGVPRDRYGDLFKKFSRIHDAAAEARKGTGVGLFLTRRIVELHGGRVGVEGEHGHWIRFWFEIPRSASDEARATRIGEH